MILLWFQRDEEGWILKILIATDTYQPSINGVVTSVLNLKSGLEALGHNVRILTLSATTKSYYENKVYYVGSYNMSAFYPDIHIKAKPSAGTVTQIVNWGPDIIHTQNEFSTFYIAKKIARKLSIPIVHTYHTMYEDYAHYLYAGKLAGRLVVKQGTHYIASHVCGIIAPTQKTYNSLKGYGIDIPLDIVPTGISLEKFDTPLSEEIRSTLLEQLGIPAEHFVMVSVSRIGKEKNIHELIDYMSALKGRKISLVIVGDGPYRKELVELVEKLQLTDCVKFTGMIPPAEISHYYQLANLFVSASTSETQGLTYIEALASGTPILCRKDDCLEGVLVEGYQGYSYTKKDEFLKNLDGFIEGNQCALMSARAKETAQRYTIQAFATRIEHLYHQHLVSSVQKAKQRSAPRKKHSIAAL